MADYGINPNYKIYKMNFRPRSTEKFVVNHLLLIHLFINNHNIHKWKETTPKKF